MDAMKDKAGKSRASAVTSQQHKLENNQHKLQAQEALKEILKPQALYLQQSEQVKKKTLLKIENYRFNDRTKKPFPFAYPMGLDTT